MCIRDRVKTILCTCHTCQTSKYPNQHIYVKMRNIVMHDKNELLCIDFPGPLPHASQGMRNLVVCTDGFTKHVSLHATGRPMVEAVLKGILEKYIPKYGYIKKILSDQGKQFQNEKWKAELGKRNTQALLTSIRRPQVNLAERFNRELGRLFRMYCNTNQSKWPEYLEFFELGINGSYNTTCLLYTSRCV